MSVCRAGSCCGLSYAKVVTVVCLAALVANYFLFLQYRATAVVPREEDRPGVEGATPCVSPQVPVPTFPGHTASQNPTGSGGDTPAGTVNSDTNTAAGEASTRAEGKGDNVGKGGNTAKRDSPSRVENPGKEENTSKGEDLGKGDKPDKGDKPSQVDANSKAGVQLIADKDHKMAADKMAAPNSSAVLPLCPEKPQGLVGRFKPLMASVELTAVEQKYRQVKFGGKYQPPDCRAREKLAIIIPCRNREEHLHILLNNLVGMLVKQKLDFSIFVIDQEMPTTFNRGMLFNVGFLEALKRGQFDCFIFHDVDMIPTNDQCLYRCSHHPRHFLAALSKWNYDIAYRGYYGGVVSFTREQYQKINGGSNLYFGWGGEDDDLRFRVLNKGYSVVRYPKLIGRYDTWDHKRDSGNRENPARHTLVEQAAIRQDKEGLSTTKYKVTQVTETPLFTKIKAFINMTQVLQSSKRFIPYGYRVW